MAKKRVHAYFDGSNFYHLANKNYGISKIKFDVFTNQLLKINSEKLTKIQYFTAPVNQQESPEAYSGQQKFFHNLRNTSLMDLHLGKLVRRKLNKINVVCSKCGTQKSESLNCPKCDKTIDLKNTYKSTEKGVDVHLATNLLLDAITDKYDLALLFSGDADFCPAINHIIKKLGKEVVFCHFPTPKTNELIQCCSESRLITKEMIKKSLL